MTADDSPYAFRRATEADMPLLSRWRASPHVMRWWGDPAIEPEAEKLCEPRVRMWIVEHENQPFAFAQDYGVHDWGEHPFAGLPPGSRGIDQYIGEADMLGQGHGPAFVKLHVERLFAEGVPAVGTDPHPDNLRARRAYEKADFRKVTGPVSTPWGLVVLMERRADVVARSTVLKTSDGGGSSSARA